MAPAHFMAVMMALMNKFGGIATDEIYFIKAECAARSGNKDEALDVLNTLLAKRYKNGTFKPVTEPDAGVALQTILTEKEEKNLCGEVYGGWI